MISTSEVLITIWSKMFQKTASKVSSRSEGIFYRLHWGSKNLHPGWLPLMVSTLVMTFNKNFCSSLQCWLNMPPKWCLAPSIQRNPENQDPCHHNHAFHCITSQVTHRHFYHIVFFKSLNLAHIQRKLVSTSLKNKWRTCRHISKIITGKVWMFINKG